MRTFDSRQPFRATWAEALSLVLVAVVLLLAGCDGTGAPLASAPATGTGVAASPLATIATRPPQPAGPLKRSATGDLIPQADLAELPVEAAATITLIQAGGPFPFERDGAVFGNFEDRLPAAARGAYREYTVITPGSDDRGARRIVTGNGPTAFSYYYTDDHYESFIEVILPVD